jgi:curved DNA-binding protein CbpA
MLKKIDDLNFYELLEVSPDVNSQEIHKAYDRVRKVYEPNSIALYSLLSPDETDRIRHRIDEAYRTLIYDETRREYDRILRERHELPETPPKPKPRYQPPPIVAPPSQIRSMERPPLPSADNVLPAIPTVATPPPQPLQTPSANITDFTGPVIKLLRESKGLSLQGVADATKISARHLQHIEEEAFVKLPVRPYLRGFSPSMPGWAMSRTGW